MSLYLYVVLYNMCNDDLQTSTLVQFRAGSGHSKKKNQVKGKVARSKVIQRSVADR